MQPGPEDGDKEMEMSIVGMARCSACEAEVALSGSRIGPHRTNVTQPRLSYLIPRAERCPGSGQLPCG